MAFDILNDLNVGGDIVIANGVGNLNINRNELQNARLQNLASAPTSPVVGQVFYNTTTNLTGVYNGTVWVYFDSSTSDRDRTNHTGTQLASTISDFDTQVRTNRLDQMAAPTASVSMNSQRITSLGTPSASDDAVTKSYVDNIMNGIRWKEPARLATTANITLSGNQTIDGFTTSANDRILVKNQTTASQNGIYLASATAWTRAEDFNSSAEIPSTALFVQLGTVNADTSWNCTNDTGVVVGTTAITFVQFAAPANINAGAGLEQSGNTYSVKVDGNAIFINGSSQVALRTDEGINGSGLTTSANGVKLSLNTTQFAIQSNQLTLQPAYNIRRATGTITGNGTLTSFDITHNLNTKQIVTEIFDVDTDTTVLVETKRKNLNEVTVTFKVAPVNLKTYNLVIIG